MFIKLLTGFIMIRFLFAIICTLTCSIALSASPAPTSITLDPSSDTGVSSSDNITNLNNTTTAKALVFNVTGTVPGATVSLYVGGKLLGSTVATGTTTQVVTNGSIRLGLSNILEQISAVQTVPGDTDSPSVTAFVAIDAYPPPSPPGMLDQSFGTNGRVFTAFRQNSQVSSVAIQSDGKILTGGVTSMGFSTDDFALVRYSSNGTLDSGFGTGGKVEVDFSSQYDQVYALAVQSDGRILAVGQSHTLGLTVGAAARLNGDGTLDTTFGTGGKVNVGLGTNTTIFNGVAVQTDGKVLVCGQLDSGAFVSRFNSDGTLDTVFGTSGKTVVTGFGTFHGMKLMSDGRFYAVGSMNSGFVLCRFLSSGALDASFGTGGMVTLRVDSNTSIALCMELQSDGKPVVAGYSFIPGTFQQQFALARYDTSGNLDSGFGTAGIVTTSVTTGDDTVKAVAAQSDGKLIAVGTGENFTAVRYNSDGSLDSTFGSGGRTTTAVINFPTSQANAIAIQSNGTIIIAGQAGRVNGYDMALVSYLAQSPTQCISLDPASDTGLVGDNSTAIANPTLDVQSSDFYYRIYDNGEQVSNDYETTSAFGITPLSDGTHSITTCSVDVAGNVSPLGSPLMLTITAGAPLISMTFTPSVPTFNDTVHVDIQFDQAVSGFDATDIKLTNATFVGLSGSGSHYVLDIDPVTYGTSTVFIPGAAAVNGSNVGNVRARLNIPIDKLTPVITWNTPGNIIYGTTLPGSILNANADVQGSFTYTPALGALLTAGPHTLSVLFTPTSQNYKNASATVSLTVDKASPFITWNNPADLVYGASLSSTQLNASASVLGSFAYSPPFGTVPNAGIQLLSVHFTPQDVSNYLPVDAQVSLNVHPAIPSVTWTPPPAFEYGTPLSAVQLNASANVPGTFNYVPGIGTVLNAGLQTVNLQFVPTSTNYNSVNTARTINVLQQAALASWVNPPDISEATPLSDAQLNATANIAGHFIYDPPSGTRLTPGIHTLSAALIPLDAANFSAPPVLIVTIQVAALPVLQSVQMSSVLQLREPGDFLADSSGYGSPQVSWTFGDGNGAAGNSVAHSFLVAGTYNVTVSATDVLGGVVSLTSSVVVLPLGTGSQTDSDGDGFPDAVETAAGTSPKDGNDTPFGGAPSGDPLMLQVAKLNIGLNFVKKGRDTISVSGSLPLGSQQADQSLTVILDVGGVVNVFNVSKGNARNGAGRFSLAFSKTASGATFKAQLTGSFSSYLNEAGLTADRDIKAEPRSIIVTVYCMNRKFQTQSTKSWTAKKGKSGALR
jgi:uncharacterized delta-60 repeat protein